MKKHIALLVANALFGFPLLATAAQNFSGAWVRDNAKSDPTPNLQYWRTRDSNSGGAAGGGRGGGGRARGGAPAETVMTIQQDTNSLTITSPQGAVQKYTLDGKPFNKTADTGMTKAVVGARFQGDTVVISTTQPWGGMPGNVALEIKEVWSVSADGNVLTVTTSRNSPAQQSSYKTIYNKK